MGGPQQSTDGSVGALQMRVAELEGELGRLRGQLGKAKGVNDAMWETVVKAVLPTSTIAHDNDVSEQTGSRKRQRTVAQ